MLTVYIDFKSPASYLALEPILALAAETGLEITWLPFSSRRFSVPAEQPDESVGDRHRRVRATSQRNTHLHYAGLQKREMRFSNDPAGSDAALAVLAGMETDPLPFIKAAFAAYWVDQADLDDEQAVRKLLQSVAVAPPLQSIKNLEEIRNEALDRGIFDTPSFLIKDELFIGREHMPWIRSLILAE